MWSSGALWKNHGIRTTADPWSCHEKENTALVRLCLGDTAQPHH